MNNIICNNVLLKVDIGRWTWRAKLRHRYITVTTFGLVFSVSTEHKREPRTSHIQIWAYSPSHPHQNYYYRCRCLRKFWSYSDHMTQRFQFVCRFIKIFHSLLSSDTTVYRLPSQLLYLSSTLWSRRYRLSWATPKRYDRWEERDFDLWLWPRDSVFWMN